MKRTFKRIFSIVTGLLLICILSAALLSCSNGKKEEKPAPTVQELFEQLKLEDVTVDYDGKEHSIAITGDLPDTATVDYTGNGKVFPGKYRVTAKVLYEGKVKTYTANLTINYLESQLASPAEQTYYLTQWKSCPVEFTLNNTEQEIDYKVKASGVEVDKSFLYKEGVYDVEVYAKASQLYKESNHVQVKLIVEKGQFDVLFEDKTFIKDGQEKTISLSGTVPSPYTVEYENNSGKECGTYYAKAIIKDASGSVLETHQAIMKIDNEDNAEFETYLNNFFVEYLEGDQLSVNIFCENPADYGLGRYDAVWYTYQTPTTSSSMEEIVAGFDKYLTELHTFHKDQLSTRQQIAYRQIEDFITYRKNYYSIDENIDYMENHYVDQFGGYVADFGTYMEAYALRTEADVVDIVNFILSTEQAFASYVDYLNDKKKAGYPLSDFTLNAMMDYLDEVLSSVENGGHYYLADVLVSKIDQLTFLDATSKSKYKQSIQDALDKEFMNGVKALKAGIVEHLGDLPKEQEGYWSVYAKGKDLYVLELGNLLGMDLTEDEAMKKYIKELDDAIKSTTSQSSLALNQIATDYNITTYAELYELLEKSTIYDGTPEEMLEYLKEFAKTIVPDLDYTPNITIKEMDEASAKVSNAVAYYMKSALDNKNSEFITLNPIKLGDKNDVLGTLSHEGYPGHLYAYCYSKQQNLHNISKIMTSTAHGEGWATYVELKLYEYAKQNTTDSKFKSIIDYLYYDQLSSFLVETRVDVGIHYEGWNIEKVAEWLDDNLLNGEAATEIYQLLIETPTSYAAYGYGKLVFYNLHKEAQEVLGVYYNEIDFNAMLLSKGWTSLGVLLETYQQYMTEQCHRYKISYQ